MEGIGAGRIDWWRVHGAGFIMSGLYNCIADGHSASSGAVGSASSTKDGSWVAYAGFGCVVQGKIGCDHVSLAVRGLWHKA
jgi:hypothetical protein